MGFGYGWDGAIYWILFIIWLFSVSGVVGALYGVDTILLSFQLRALVQEMHWKGL